VCACCYLLLQGILFASDEVESQYDYYYCYLGHIVDGVFHCGLESKRTVYISPLRPPFLYNNLCTSTILTSYIPVYLFVYAIQLLVSVLLVVVLTSIEYTSLPAWLRKGLHGVFWPGHEWISDSTKPRDLLKATEIISFDILNHLAVFVTFGISSPYLALILIFSVCLKLYIWRLIIGRFVYARSCESSETVCDIGGCQQSGDVGLASLSSACLPVMDMLEGCMRPIVLSSAVFFACVCWDLAGDEVDWRGSIWAPVTVLMVPVVLWCVLEAARYFKTKRSHAREMVVGGNATVGNPMQASSSLNPEIEMRTSGVF